MDIKYQHVTVDGINYCLENIDLTNGTADLKQSMGIYKDSVLFITTNDDDANSGFTAGENYIWAHGKLFCGSGGGGSIQTVEGSITIDMIDQQNLDISIDGLDDTKATGIYDFVGTCTFQMSGTTLATEDFALKLRVENSEDALGTIQILDDLNVLFAECLLIQSGITDPTLEELFASLSSKAFRTYAGNNWSNWVFGLVHKIAITGDYNDLKNTPTDFTGATALSGGTNGLVPAPTSNDYAKFLKGDGTWANLPNNVIYSTLTIDTTTTPYTYTLTNLDGITGSGIYHVVVTPSSDPRNNFSCILQVETYRQQYWFVYQKLYTLDKQISAYYMPISGALSRNGSYPSTGSVTWGNWTEDIVNITLTGGVGIEIGNNNSINVKLRNNYQTQIDNPISVTRDSQGNLIIEELFGGGKYTNINDKEGYLWKGDTNNENECCYSFVQQSSMVSDNSYQILYSTDSGETFQSATAIYDITSNIPGLINTSSQYKMYPTNQTRKIKLIESTLSKFTGASQYGGVTGLVPAPSNYDGSKYLKGDGTWSFVDGASITGTGIALYDSNDSMALTPSSLTFNYYNTPVCEVSSQSITFGTANSTSKVEITPSSGLTVGYFFQASGSGVSLGTGSEFIVSGSGVRLMDNSGELKIGTGSNGVMYFTGGATLRLMSGLNLFVDWGSTQVFSGSKINPDILPSATTTFPISGSHILIDDSVGSLTLSYDNNQYIGINSSYFTIHSGQGNSVSISDAGITLNTKYGDYQKSFSIAGSYQTEVLKEDCRGLYITGTVSDVKINLNVYGETTKLEMFTPYDSSGIKLGYFDLYGNIEPGFSVKGIDIIPTGSIVTLNANILSGTLGTGVSFTGLNSTQINELKTALGLS